MGPGELCYTCTVVAQAGAGAAVFAMSLPCFIKILGTCSRRQLRSFAQVDKTAARCRDLKRIEWKPGTGLLMCESVSRRNKHSIWALFQNNHDFLHSHDALMPRFNQRWPPCTPKLVQ